MCRHCLDLGCIHCREQRRERERENFQARARVRQRSNAQRAALGLMPRHVGPPSVLRPLPLGHGFLGLLPKPQPDRARRQLGNSVLPAHFHV